MENSLAATPTTPQAPTRASERLASSPSSLAFSRKRPRSQSESPIEKTTKAPHGKENMEEEAASISAIVMTDAEKQKSNVNTEVNHSAGPDIVALENADRGLIVNRGLTEEHAEEVGPIGFEIDELSLFILGSQDDVNKILKRLFLMKKLAILVGCGLDCHFRSAQGSHMLMMLVRGAPRCVFGTTVCVFPEKMKTRKYMVPSHFIDVGQQAFFDSILSLIPSSLNDAKSHLKQILMNGEENIAILELYGFLGSIRMSVLSQISTIPQAWTIDDFPSKDKNLFNSNFAQVMQQCGDEHLMRLENARPGYTNMVCHSWGLGPAHTFEERMKAQFDSIGRPDHSKN